MEAQTEQKYTSQAYADTIFMNGNIITMDQNNFDGNKAQYVGVKEGKIINVGINQAQKQKIIGKHTQIIDLKGKTMLPGFIDPHIHYTFSHMSNWIDISPFVNSNMTQIWEKIEKSVQKAQPGQWIRAYGYDYVVTPGQPIDFSIQRLDKLSKQNPIIIIQINYHVAYANTAAFIASGIFKQSTDPPHCRFIRNKEGDLTGRIQQVPGINYISNHAPTIQMKEYIQNIHNFFKRAASKGCTSLHDCGIGAYKAQMDLQALRSVMKEDPWVRMSGFLVSHAWEYWKELQLKPQKDSDMLRINGIKCWSDGSIQCGSAYLNQPYSKIFCACGAANYSQQYLDNIVQQAHQDGWQIGIHANGDAAIDMVLNSYEKAIKKNPRQDCRHRIEHCTMGRQDQFKRMKQLDIHPSFLIGHIYYYGELFSEILLGQKRGLTVHSVKTAIQCGLTPTLHSDDRCQPINPLRCIYNAVSRRTKKTGKIMNQNQKVSIHQALKMMTINAAWQCHTDDIVGSIKQGKLADFVILDKNILNEPQDSIMDIKIVETWLNGKIKYKNTDL